MWTRFWDMNSGGGQKEDFDRCYVELPEDEAVRWFYNRFGHNPHRVTCTCCGPDYSISEFETLAEATAYHRNATWSQDANGYVEERDASHDRYYNPGRARDAHIARTSLISVEDYRHKPDVLVVEYGEAKADGIPSYDPPRQGYVWED